jgi:hypothetical protein
LRHTVDVECIVVLSVAMGSSRSEVCSVGVCRAWDGSKPSVEQDKVLSHGAEDTDLVWSVVVDDLSSTSLVGSVVGEGLFGHESSHVLLFVQAVCSSFIWMICAEDLHVDTTDAVVWVIGSNVIGTRASTNIILLFRVRSVPKFVSLEIGNGRAHLHGVTVVVVQQPIDRRIVREASSKGIE